MLDWLNYHHLHYFWMVAKEGGITAAAEKLHLAQPTLSSQIQKLEKSMGVKLFERVGRGLVLSEMGQTVFRFADEIFRYLSLPKTEFPEAAAMFEQPLMDRVYFDHLTDTFRSPHLWKFENGAWALRHTVWSEA